MSEPELIPLGERAFIVRFGMSLDISDNHRAIAVGEAIKSAALEGLTDVVPANSSVGVYFSGALHAKNAEQSLSALLKKKVESGGRKVEMLHEIRVVYSGPDLAEVARVCKLSTREVIEIHSAREYNVFAIGFAPGFAYMGEVDEVISVPRRAQPRTKVPAGSVAIANRQTAVYPFESPGGWNLIGVTDARIFDIARNPAALLKVGDRVRFVAQ